MANIDPDMVPILEGIDTRIGDLTVRVEQIESSPIQSPDLSGLAARIEALEQQIADLPVSGGPITISIDTSDLVASVDSVAAAVRGLAAGEENPTDPPPPSSPELPEGYRAMGDYTRRRGDQAGAWDASNNIVMTTWQGGVGTMGDPSLCDWRADGSVVLTYNHDGKRSGVLQFNRPTFKAGRIGAVIEVLDPGAVCAFFTYAQNALEFDFELIKKDGAPVWAIGIHVPKAGGGVVSSPKVYVPLKSGPHEYEIEHTAEATTFYIDKAQVARFTPADVPGSTWSIDTTMQTLFSVEWHQGWAGWSNDDYAGGASMRVLGYRA